MARWEEDRRMLKQTQEEKEERRKATHLESLRQAKVDALSRATAKRERERQAALREKKIQEINEVRMKKWRERQYLEQAKAAQEPNFAPEPDDETQDGEEVEEHFE